MALLTSKWVPFREPNARNAQSRLGFDLRRTRPKEWALRTVRVLQKLLGIERARVVGVRFDEDDRGQMVVVSLELHKNARSRCPHCKKRCPGYDQPAAPRRWRHLDMGGWRCFLELPAKRVQCPRHDVKTELVPWARPEAKMTRAFDDTVAPTRHATRRRPRLVTAPTTRPAGVDSDAT